MAKRACPFEDNCAPQLKVHVGSDVIDRRNEKYMKNIYDRTLSKLYQAVNNNNKESSFPKEQPSVKNLNDPPSECLCIECKKVQCIKGNCWFCEALLCNDCIKACSLCSELFCSRCSVAIYKNGNNYSCLTCYS